MSSYSMTAHYQNAPGVPSPRPPRLCILFGMSGRLNARPDSCASISQMNHWRFSSDSTAISFSNASRSG